MLEVKNLTKKYGKFLALDKVTFNIKKGEVFGILGPNGAGKSTMIKILTCFHKATSGTARINDISIKDKDKIKPLIGWVPQEESFYFGLTVEENLHYFGALFNLKKNERKERITKLLKLLKIEEKRKAIAASLSGGMKRRLSIAIALIHDPKVVYLDEPTAGVDPVSRMALWEVIRAIKKEGVTIMFCTHHLNEADLLCDRIAILKAGQILRIDTPKKLKGKYGKTLEEAFVNIVSEK